MDTASGEGKRHKNLSRGIRGEAIHSLKTKGDAERLRKKTEAMEKAEAFLKKKKALGLKANELADWLFGQLSLPSGWNISKLRRKSGKPRTHPVMIIDDVGFRIASFLKFLKIKSKKKNDLGKRSSTPPKAPTMEI